MRIEILTCDGWGFLEFWILSLGQLRPTISNQFSNVDMNPYTVLLLVDPWCYDGLHAARGSRQHSLHGQEPSSSPCATEALKHALDAIWHAV